MSKLLIWRDINDGDTIHIGQENTFQPEKRGRYNIQLSIHIDPFSDAFGDAAYNAVKALRPGQMAEVEITLVVKT